MTTTGTGPTPTHSLVTPGAPPRRVHAQPMPARSAEGASRRGRRSVLAALFGGGARRRHTGYGNRGPVAVPAQERTPFVLWQR